ncbi:hypothetical protein OROGR_017159 [Orobanche gracilis]
MNLLQQTGTQANLFRSAGDDKNARISSTHKALGIDMARNSGMSTLDSASATLFSCPGLYFTS